MRIRHNCTVEDRLTDLYPQDEMEAHKTSASFHYSSRKFGAVPCPGLMRYKRENRRRTGVSLQRLDHGRSVRGGLEIRGHGCTSGFSSKGFHRPDCNNDETKPTQDAKKGKEVLRKRQHPHRKQRLHDGY